MGESNQTTRTFASPRHRFVGLVWVTTLVCCLLFGLSLPGCFFSPADSTALEIEIWGKRGIDPGRFIKPRAITVDDEGRIYVVDMTARIQVFTLDGQHLRYWHTPESQFGKPCGLSISHDGLLMVADTHYFRILFYTPAGDLVPERTIGKGNGRGPGEFGFVTDIVQDSLGNYYVSEYGDYDRIQKFSPSGEYILEWGGHGSEPGEFLRPQGLAMDSNDHLWVADASNHRIQVFDVSRENPIPVLSWGQQGTEPGKLRYPYSVILEPEGTVLVAEFGNHRIQRFTRDGRSLGIVGQAGREIGQFFQPWSACRCPDGRIHVLDSYNHRIQSFYWPVDTGQPTTEVAQHESTLPD